MKPWLLAGAAAIGLGLIGWLGYATWFAKPAEQAAVPTGGTTALDDVAAPSNVETIDVAPTTDLVKGTTPMAQRVAVLGLLNKRNGVARDVTLKPGEAVRLGDVVLRLRACEQTAPWEVEHYTGAFVQVDVEQINKSWRRVFSGWLFKERPGLNVVQHPIYDVWTKSCAMSFPAGGTDTVASGDAKPSRSSAPKSPGATSGGTAADEGAATLSTPPAAGPGPGAPVAAGPASSSTPSKAPATASPRSPR